MHRPRVVGRSGTASPRQLPFYAPSSPSLPLGSALIGRPPLELARPAAMAGRRLGHAHRGLVLRPRLHAPPPRRPWMTSATTASPLRRISLSDADAPIGASAAAGAGDRSAVSMRETRTLPCCFFSTRGALPDTPSMTRGHGLAGLLCPHFWVQSFLGSSCLEEAHMILPSSVFVI